MPPLKRERPPASSAAPLSDARLGDTHLGDTDLRNEVLPPLPEPGWLPDRELPKLIFGGPTAFMLVAILGATAMQASFMVGAAVIAIGLAGAGGTALIGYASLYRRWRHIRSHAQALGRLIVANDSKDQNHDEHADIAFRLVTVAGSHRSVRALPQAREQLESLHKQVTGSG